MTKTNCKEPMISEKVIAQIQNVLECEMSDMTDIDTVLSVAYDNHWFDLYHFLREKENRPLYSDYLVFGRERIADRIGETQRKPYGIEFFRAHEAYDFFDIQSVHTYEWFSEHDYVVISEDQMRKHPSRYKNLRPYLNLTYLSQDNNTTDYYKIVSAFMFRKESLGDLYDDPVIISTIGNICAPFKELDVVKVTPKMQEMLLEYCGIDLQDHSKDDNLFFRYVKKH